MSAAELAAQLQRDPEYQAREKEKERTRLARAAATHGDAARVIQELVAAGFPVNSLADLRREQSAYVRAIPILLAWLPRIENSDVKQDIVRCLSVPWAKSLAAAPLVEAFRLADDSSETGLRWAIGNALEVVGDDAVLDDMIELAKDRRYGRAREMVVVGLGNMTDGRVLPVLIDLLNDDEVCGHAIIALGKLKALTACAYLKPFLKHPKSWMRTEAKKAIEKIDKSSRGLH